jgi:putative flippase GtrA
MKRFFAWLNSMSEKIRFLIAGGYNTAFGMTLFAVLHHYLQDYLHYQIILVMEHMVSVVNSFLTFKYYTFRSKGNAWREFKKVNLTYVLSLTINSILLYAFVELVGLHPVLGQVCSVGIVAVITYLMHKHFSFKEFPTTTSS